MFFCQGIPQKLRAGKTISRKGAKAQEIRKKNREGGFWVLGALRVEGGGRRDIVRKNARKYFMQWFMV
jgi:hypothetical protein